MDVKIETTMIMSHAYEKYLMTCKPLPPTHPRPNTLTAITYYIYRHAEIQTYILSMNIYVKICIR